MSGLQGRRLATAGAGYPGSDTRCSQTDWRASLLTLFILLFDPVLFLLFLFSRPGFLNDPAAGGRGARGQAPRDQRGFVQRLWQDYIVAPNKIEGNVTIGWAVLVFAGGIVATRTLAKDMIVPSF